MAPPAALAAPPPAPTVTRVTATAVGRRGMLYLNAGSH